MFSNSTPLWFAAGLCLLPAQEILAAEDSAMEVTQVTATHTKQSVNSTLAPVTVFTLEDIDRLQALDLVDVLDRTPGVSITPSGSKGSLASFYMRGTGSKHTLFLIDGQRFSSATLGSTNYQFLNTEQIERVEVVRGPRSSLYGSDAVGGVVQVFTKKGYGDPEGYVKAGMGSHNAWEVAGGVRGKTNNFRYATNLSQFETDGFDSFTNDTPPNDDDDGFRNKSISANFGYDFDYGGVLDFNYYYTKARLEADDHFSSGGIDPYSNNWIQSVNASFSTPIITDVWFTTVMLGSSTDDSDNINKLDHSQNTHYRTKRYSSSWQNDFTINDSNRMTFGLDDYLDKVKSSSNYVDPNGTEIKDRYNLGAFYVYQLDISIFDLQVGLRWDDNEHYGENTTGNIATGFKIGDAHKIVLSYGQGYKVPTFNDLYFLGPWGNGNPNLQAEDSEQYEIEFRGDYSVANWSLNIYQNEIDNLIEWQPVDPNAPWSPYSPENVNKAKIKGAELVGGLFIDEWVINGSLNYVDATDNDTGKQLINRPKRFLSVDADRNFNKVIFGASWRAYSKSYGDQANTKKMAGYGVVDLRTGYQFTKDFKAQLQFNNVFNKDYENRYGYNTDGANWYLTASYTF